MKSLTLLLVPLILLSSCTIDWKDEKDAKITELTMKIVESKKQDTPVKEVLPLKFTSEKLWVSFTTLFNTPGVFAMNLEAIQFLPKYDQYYSLENQPIRILYRNPDESAEEKIKKLIQATWRAPEKCKVGSIGTDSDWFTHYSIDLKDKNIPLTQGETKAIADAKKSSLEYGWVEWIFTEIEIYNNYLLDTCGKYAEWVPPATSTTYSSYFISASGTMTMLYHPAWADPSFINWGTLKLSDPQSN